jgi:predicted methyltransferase
MKSALLAAALSALMLAGSPALAQTAPSSLVQSAVADTLRPADEVARDPLRHPAEILAFAQVQPGQRVADIRPGAGYFTRLFSRVVGEGGHVYAFVPNKTAER